MARLTYDTLDRKLSALARDYAVARSPAEYRAILVRAARLPGARAAALASRARALAHLGEAIGVRA